ncbi:MAG: sodium/proline symporter [Cyanobacteria bacterium HKST-UBA04]|nr:sodium/proline symporter [Cyanobacteria bacterium HKST-UBA04]
MIMTSFLCFLFCFVLIGLSSSFKKQATKEDYLLATHNIKPWQVALASVATNSSGYMFIGLIGFTYLTGLSSAWVMIGWVFGDLIASLFIHEQLRRHSEQSKALSFASALSRWHGTDYKLLRLIGGIITVIFLGVYAAAQLKAGSKAMEALFGWPHFYGAVMGGAMVLVYCFAGGIRASIWTNVAQSFVMIVAMGLLFFVSIHSIGGFGAYWSKLALVQPGYLSLFPDNLQLVALPAGWLIAPFLFVMGWMFAGFGVVGQPHIMVHFMTMDQPNQMTRTRLYYYSWYTFFSAAAIGTGLAARLLLPDVAHFDAELALPVLAGQLLPDVLVGLILAGLFAATMSTADSQILCCTAAISNDLTPDDQTVSYMATKFITVGVTLMALLIAMWGPDSVFSLVLIAWSALACAFAPLLTVYALNQRVSQVVALTMMLVGFATMMAWRLAGLTGVTYEILPGIMAGFSVFSIAKLLGLSQPAPRQNSDNC